MSVFTTWKIEPRGTGWTVRRHDRNSHESRHEEKEAAIQAATDRASENRPSRILVYSQDGSIARAFHYKVRDASPVLPDERPDLTTGDLGQFVDRDAAPPEGR